MATYGAELNPTMAQASWDAIVVGDQNNQISWDVGDNISFDGDGSTNIYIAKYGIFTESGATYSITVNRTTNDNNIAGLKIVNGTRTYQIPNGNGEYTFTHTHVVGDNDRLYVYRSYSGKDAHTTLNSLSIKQQLSGDTWKISGGSMYGAMPDQRGAIGGDVGYTERIVSGQADVIVTNYAELSSALSSATTGDIIWIDGTATIDFGGQVNLSVGADNVTIASDRGFNNSSGALLKTDIDTHDQSLFYVSGTGAGLRLTGLRLQGSNGTTTNTGNNTFGIRMFEDNLEVDNCEIYNFGFAGIYVKDCLGGNIHHNYIHHNQMAGYGYGIVTYGTATVDILYNRFDYGRHYISGSGEVGQGYNARYNIGELGGCTDALFDMHGDITLGGSGFPAGDLVHVHNNYFKSGYGVACGMAFGGDPRTAGYVSENWYPAFDSGDRIVWHDHSAGLTIFDTNNIWGVDNIYP